MKTQNEMRTEVFQGDCLDILPKLPSDSVDLVYMDPPFCTQREQRLAPRDRSRTFSFSDSWKSLDEYAHSLVERLREIHRVIKPSGSIFFHCDKTASHVARIVLDEVFTPSNFRSEIIWHYKRWSNSADNLLPSHQTILLYSKTKRYKFNSIFTDYSPTTNIDQILQKRGRDAANKSVYARDDNGDIITNGSKKGVPLSDVWDIPFLNPKAKERTGYPTQKPILLLERIINLVTSPGDIVLDPFCGSGTTLVAASLLAREAIGIDTSEEAVQITRARLASPIKTESRLLQSGIDAYKNADENALRLLNGVPHLPVQRNNGIDAFLQETFHGVPIPVRVQKRGEDLAKAANALFGACKTKKAEKMILIVTEDVPVLDFNIDMPSELIVIDSTELSIVRALKQLKKEENSR